MAPKKRLKHRVSLLAGIEDSNLGVVHRLSHKLLGTTPYRPGSANDGDDLPSLRTLQNMSTAILKEIGTVMDINMSKRGTNINCGAKPNLQKKDRFGWDAK